MLILSYIDSTVAALTKDESEFKMYIVQSISNWLCYNFVFHRFNDVRLFHSEDENEGVLERKDQKIKFHILLCEWCRDLVVFFSNHAQLPLALDLAAVVVEVAVALGLAVEEVVGVGVVVAAAVLVVVVYVYVFLIVIYSQ